VLRMVDKEGLKKKAPEHWDLQYERHRRSEP